MCGKKKTSCIDTDGAIVKCWAFVCSVIFSIIAVVIAIIGLTGQFSKTVSSDFYTGLITLVIGIWIKSPSMRGIISVDTEVSSSA